MIPVSVDDWRSAGGEGIMLTMLSIHHSRLDRKGSVLFGSISEATSRRNIGSKIGSNIRCLLVAECFDRVHFGGADGRVQSAEQSDADSNHHSQRDGP